MATTFPIEIPASYVPPLALAFAGPEEKALLVTADRPLPVSLRADTSYTDALTGTMEESGATASFSAVSGRAIWLTLSGEWSGMTMLQRSTDGTTWHNLTLSGKIWGQFTGNICEAVTFESEADTYYRLLVDILSGTLTFRIAQ
ncbi:hypothetical protein D6851_11065 [Altericroceibacterium spongiae]|uniref:Uncharacterized protein n=1 Tax=Altericroceibacterium spongiae TaxID=2320269 RepID=A0A420EJ21_9SPHN|nr:hypothetical protein [Altericroceibacterium spongiae]RKF20664.1 hypothetical protein D6851_11065 [Altericroceibacterium spongiae]